MKYLIYFLLVSALAVLIYSTTFLNFDHLLQADSGIAVICVLGAFCVILLLSILLVSRKIKEKTEILEEN
jgi:predicted membrane-bound dolichyl-phosphate-mannose-protein mannosyltransferase